MSALFASDAAVIVLLGALVGASCAILGVFLVLRRVSMLTDAISHSILLGIVGFFFITEDVGSPLLLVGATLAGLLTVGLTEALSRTRLVKEDAAIGLVFPALFALAVLLLNLYAENVHLDVHAVLLGEIIYAPYDTVAVGGLEVPRGVLIMGVIGLLDLAFISLLYKELKLSTFDAGLASALGFAPWLVHYGLLGLTSLTAVGAFDAVGAILVVAFMIIPPAAAYLLTDRLWLMLALAVLIAVASSAIGFWLARLLDVSVSGMMASVTGGFLALAVVAGPRYGVVARALARRRQGLEADQRMLVVHLHRHRADPGPEERQPIALQTHLRWSPRRAARAVEQAAARGWLRVSGNGELVVSDEGSAVARRLLP